MNESPLHRMAVVTGLAVAAAIAVWWMGSTRLALDRGSGAARSAEEALQALILIRAMALAVLCSRIGASRGWRPAVATGLLLIAPSWPVVLLAWLASTNSLGGVILGEILLLVTSLVLPLIGVALGRWPRTREGALATGTAAGIGLAAAVWLSRGLWDMALS